MKKRNIKKTTLESYTRHNSYVQYTGILDTKLVQFISTLGSISKY